MSLAEIFKKLPVKYVSYVEGYKLIPATPAIGVIYEINDFISGHIRLRGRGGGAYPYKYIEMLDNVFGREENTIEVCSGECREGNINVDINPNCDPDIIDDGEKLESIQDNTFDRWRCDPPYNEETAFKMYDVRMPSFYKLLQAGSRVIKPGSLMFLLCAQNYQICPKNVRRIGCIVMTVIPLNELRVCNIYQKLELKN